MGFRNLLTVRGIGPVLAAVFVVEQVTSVGSVRPIRWRAGPGSLPGITSQTGPCAADMSARKPGRWAAVEAVQRQGEPVVARVREDLITRRGREAPTIVKVAAGCKLLAVVLYFLTMAKLAT